MGTSGTVTSSPVHLKTLTFDRLVLRSHLSSDSSVSDYTVVSFVDDGTTSMGYDGAWDEGEPRL